MKPEPCGKRAEEHPDDSRIACTDRPVTQAVEDPPKKHPCPDCCACQFCSETRCRMCRGKGPKDASRLSLQEQIDLYNKRNQGLL